MCYPHCRSGDDKLSDDLRAAHLRGAHQDVVAFVVLSLQIGARRDQYVDGVDQGLGFALVLAAARKYGKVDGAVGQACAAVDVDAGVEQRLDVDRIAFERRAPQLVRGNAELARLKRRGRLLLAWGAG